MQNNNNLLEYWKESRLGYFTASNIWKLLKGGKGGDVFGETAKTYIDEKIAEIITGEAVDSANTYATEWGRNNEEDAVKWFAHITGHQVEHYGALNPKYFPFNDISGGSPDGMVNCNAVLEIKCPYNSTYFLEYIVERQNAATDTDFLDWFRKNHFDYYVQCQFNMMCCKSDMCFFAVYNPRVVDAELRMFWFLFLPDTDIQNMIKDRIEKASQIIKDKLAVIDSFKDSVQLP